jgi:dUTP pyrophosphatase
MDDLKDALEFNNIKIEDYIPAYGGESAGLDLFNAGNKFTLIPKKDLPKNEVTLIETGLKIKVPKGWVALIQERGSIVKTPLKVRAGVIDSGYTGEVFVNLVNVGSQEYTIDAYQKLPVQIVIVKCDNEFLIVNKEEYLDLTKTSERKEGQVGSSD